MYHRDWGWALPPPPPPQRFQRVCPGGWEAPSPPLAPLMHQDQGPRRTGSLWERVRSVEHPLPVTVDAWVLHAWPADVQSRQGRHCALQRRPLSLTNGLPIPPPHSTRHTQPAASQVIERCKFVLKFVPLACSPENKHVLKCILASSASKQKTTSANSWKKLFHGWRAMKKLQNLLQLNLAKMVNRGDATLDLLLRFVRDPKVSLPSFHARLLQRRERGRIRCLGLEYLKKMLSSAVPLKAVPFMPYH